MAKTERQGRSEALRQQIAERAYALWEEEGGPHGRDLDHWRRAEAEIASALAARRRPAASAGRKKQKRAEAEISAAREGGRGSAASAGRKKKKKGKAKT